jgi:3'-phosphoadenosine 5'-phosphosulfate sulfotransferase (PAPS reductase)/FAD synthetase
MPSYSTSTIEGRRRVVAWFSCGVTSAVATKITIEAYPEAIVAYCDTGAEHPDNARFLKDCEAWFGRKIDVLRSAKYRDIWDVFEKRRFLVSPKGALCTVELKKTVRRDFEKPDDLQIFGFDTSELPRAQRFKDNNPEVDVWYPLIERGLSKPDCLDAVRRAGIEIPAMYKLGYRNNNCIGCVKGGAGYWNKIRKDFPAVFARMAAMERKLGAAINKSTSADGERRKVFLDELDPGAGRHSDLDISCGLFCGEY